MLYVNAIFLMAISENLQKSFNMMGGVGAKPHEIGASPRTPICFLKRNFSYGKAKLL
jgi:hypothetical protein